MKPYLNDSFKKVVDKLNIVTYRNCQVSWLEEKYTKSTNHNFLWEKTGK